jgi:predicted amidohydrolase
VLSYLKDKGNSITLDFVLEGDINNPKFSLNETMSQRMAISMSDLLNVSIGGVAKGAAALGKEGVGAAAGVANGVGGAMHQIFPGKRKH